MDRVSDDRRERRNQLIADYLLADFARGGAVADAGEDVRQGEQSRQPGPLCPRTFAGGPCLSRGPAFPAIEARLQQGVATHAVGGACRASGETCFERTTMPLNLSVRRFLRAGACGTVSWAGIVGRDSRDAFRQCAPAKKSSIPVFKEPR